ncbi:MAG TPA: VanZ family protein [Acetobacteraceae bacterium]|nr:VanZ family protein [Acetobacteraceae bacterium]
MPKSASQARLWLVTVVMAAVIVYGSLYPFEFRIPPNGIGPWATLIASVWDRPSHSDVVANVLLYMPFGFFFLLSSRKYRVLVLATVTGGLMSLCMELTQYYDAGRVTNFSDLVTNTLGTLLGGLGAMAAGASFRLPLVGEVPARPVPALLIISWLAYRLYPYVPAINPHKYWNALKPIVLAPSLDGYDLFRQTAIWLTVYALLEAIVRRRQSAFVAPLFAIAVMCAKVLVIGIVIRLADPVGAGLAFFIWLPLLLLPAQLRAGVAGLVLCAYVVALRLEPFTFQAVAHEFGWIPFLSLMQGSLTVDTLAFLEKCFLYGSMIYLLGNALGHRLPAALLTAALLFATSWAETRLPGRSAEITDALMALIVTGIFVLLGPERADDRLHDPGSLSAMMAEQAQPCAGFAARAGADACRR